MKKIISLILSLTIIVTMFCSVTMVASANDSTVKTTHIDLSEEFYQYSFVTTGNTSSTTASIVDGKIAVNVSAYERQLSAYTNYSKTWFPRLLLYRNGDMLQLTSGQKVIVEVKYKVIGSINETHGVQIGIGNNSSGASTEIYVRNSRKHVAGDEGKEFTLSSVFTADSHGRIKIAFSGGGKLEITSIVVHELPSANVNDYAVVKYVDGSNHTTEFVKKNTASKTPAADGRKFEGWYASNDFSGEPVTTITNDATLYGKFTFKTTHIDLSEEFYQYSFMTTSSTSSTTASIVDGKIAVNVSAFERQLSAFTNYSKTWFPRLLLYTNGDMLQLTSGQKVIVEVKYKVIGSINETHGVQIGIGNNSSGANTEIYVRNSRKHVAGDEGKEFTLSSVFTADSYSRIKIAFSGGGKLEITSIVVHELPSEFINDYAVVKFVDDNDETTEFIKKNTALKTLENEESKLFAGWTTASGDVVTSVSEDATLTSKWVKYYSSYDVVTTQITGNYLGAAANQNFQNSTITAYNFSYGLGSKGWGGTWRQTLLFFDAATNKEIKLVNGSKYIVNMEYTVEKANNDWGLQVGLFGGILADGVTNAESTKPVDHVAHKNADIGKTFTTSYVFEATADQNIGLQFAGQGTLTLKSITLWEMPADAVNETAMVIYNDDGKQYGQFVKKNTPTKTLEKFGSEFKGWYDNTEFTGEPVNTIVSDVTLYSKWEYLYDYKDIATTNLTSNYQGAGDGDNFVNSTITINDWEYGLGSMGWGSTWRQTLLFVDNNKTAITLKPNAKYIVNVDYTIDSSNDSWGVQIGLFGGILSNGVTNSDSTRLDDYFAHLTEDVGKNFTYTAVFTAEKAQNIGLQFAGSGSVTFNSISIWELNGESTEKYSTVVYKNGNYSNGLVVKNGTAITEKLDRTLSYNFGGWYSNDAKVTEITEDTILVAKWFNKYDLTMNDTTDVRDLVCIKNALSDDTDDLLFDIDRNDDVEATDTVLLVQKLLGIEKITIDGNLINNYTVVAGPQTSFMMIEATNTLIDAFDDEFDVDLTANADAQKQIFVGIQDIDPDLLAYYALENITGSKGDVYGLNDYKIFLDDGNVYIEGGSDYATAFAVNVFVDFITENKMIPSGFEISDRYYKEKNILDGYSYVWGDEFDTELLNTGKWWLTKEKDNEAGPYYEKSNPYYTSTWDNGTWIDPDGNPNMQEGVITRPNVEGEDYYIEDGLLVLNTRKTETGYSAVRLNGTKQFTYGIMTARVKIATLNGACSTLWARSNDNNGESVNEFDLVENFGMDKIVPNLHTWNNYTDDTNHSADIADCSQEIVPNEGESLSDSFHEVTLYWTEERIVFYFDGVAYLDLDITADPEKWEAFHKSTHAVMGISAPSGYYALNYGANNPGDCLGEFIDSFYENMYIDYIRIFQK